MLCGGRSAASTRHQQRVDPATYLAERPSGDELESGRGGQRTRGRRKDLDGVRGIGPMTVVDQPARRPAEYFEGAGHVERLHIREPDHRDATLRSTVIDHGQGCSRSFVPVARRTPRIM